LHCTSLNVIVQAAIRRMIFGILANNMMNLQNNPSAKPSMLMLGLALLVVYIVWGTTYLALNIGMTEMPPLLMNASRFMAAGIVMLAIARLRGHAWPTVPQLKAAAVVGVLMVALAMVLVMYAQKLGVGSGLMATVVTTMPMWLALWTRLGGERVPGRAWAGLALGVCGASLLALEGDFSTSVLASVCAFGAPLCWSLGSYASRKLSLPGPAMAAGFEWLIGGSAALVVGLAFEAPGQMLNAGAKAWWAWLYLVGFGTLITLNAYLWLLRNTSAALAGSYAFVNPAVALVVGVMLGGEQLTGWVFPALPLIFAALALIMTARPVSQESYRPAPASAQPRESA
jgi:drug/metabolite transporter (DMT)-like permease